MAIRSSAARLVRVLVAVALLVGVGIASATSAQAAALPTTTTLAVSPASPVSAGTAVTLTATVSPAGSGSVQFFKGATAVGTAAVNGSGVATLTTTVIPVGTAPLTATFTPADPLSYAASTSAPVALTVQSVGVGIPQFTTTTLTASPTSPANAGAPVTLTATVSFSGLGTVTFRDAGVPIGSAPTAGGIAQFATSSLTIGSHSLTAAFVPADPAAFFASTSAVLAYVIQAAPAVATSTSLVASPASPGTVGQPIVFTASVAPLTGVASPSGSVTFRDGATTIGNAPLVGGVATLSTSALAVGSHAITAEFVPDTPAAFLGSTSAVLTYVIQTSGSTDSGNVQVTINAGALIISTPDTLIVLPTPTLDADGSKLTSTGGVTNDITVTDTRAGDPGWTASGQITDFQGPGTASINGHNLGWAPSIISQLPSQAVTAGPVVAPAAALLPGDANAVTPALGIKTSRTLATAAPAGGSGTAVLKADFTLYVPTVTPAGTYLAVLTLTAI